LVYSDIRDRTREPRTLKLCEGGDVLVARVAGVGEDSLWSPAGVGLDRIDEGWQEAAVGRIGRQGRSHGLLRSRGERI
jgi:hypothetical protein